jgi:putative ABC transport system substrate-binding protein
MRRRLALLSVLGVVLLLGGCGRGAATPEQPVETYQPPARSPLQQAYALLDELLLGPAPSELPVGFAALQPSFLSYPVAPVRQPYGVVGEAVLPLRGPDAGDLVGFNVAGSAGEAERLHAATPSPEMYRITGRFSPSGFQYPVVCLTGTYTAQAREFGSTNCRVLVGQVEVNSQADVLGGTDRGNDQAAVTLAQLGVRHIETVQRALAERARPAPNTRVMKVGWLAGRAYYYGGGLRREFQKRLEALGYVRDQTLLMEYRFADEQWSRLPDLARELVQEDVDVLVAEADGAIAAKAATDRIPIVFHSVGDPVAAGLVQSFGHPGGNITGLASNLPPEFIYKQFEVLKQALPGATRVAVLAGGTTPGPFWEPLRSFAASIGLELVRVGLASPADLEAQLATVPALGVDAFFDTTSLSVGQEARVLAQFQRQQRLPLMVTGRTDYAVVSYGPDPLAHYRQTADYVDKILKGSRPADLPVQGPTEFELLVNLREARAIGLTFPPAFLARATRVIE